MAQDIFLQFVPVAGFKGDIKGESQDTAHKDWIVVEQWEHGYENQTTVGSTSGGAGAGKAVLSEVRISKCPDRSTPGLLGALFAGAHFERVIAVFRRSGGSGGNTPPYLRIELEMVFVSKYSLSGDGEEAREDIVLRAGAVRQSFVTQTPTGAADKTLLATWSFTQNRVLP